jgi:hypothetical protein
MTSEDGQQSDAQKKEHDSLKYQLLGPSLTKAGQESVDQAKVRKAAATPQQHRQQPKRGFSD